MQSFNHIPLGMMQDSARYLARVNSVAPDSVLNIVRTVARVSYELLADSLTPANDDGGNCHADRTA